MIRLTEQLRSIFRDWPEKIMQPVTVNLMTAFILFSMAFIFKPLILEIIHGPKVENYPISCTGEPYYGTSEGEIRTDFFIINRMRESFTRPSLAALLKTLEPGVDSALSPDIILNVDGNTPFAAFTDKSFNSDKGHLSIDIDEEHRSIQIRIDRIEAQAILKVIVVVRDRPFVDKELSRMAKALVPFDLERYHDACYQR